MSRDKRSGGYSPNNDEQFLFGNGASCVEHLESRLLLAGSVKLTLKGNGDVQIRGDGKDNHVEISVVGDSLRISGEPDRNGDATTIKFEGNEVSEVLINAPSGVLAEKLVVNLGGGNDFLRIHDAEFQSQVSFSGGGGGDSLGVFGATFEELLKIRGGGGNEAIILRDSVFNANIDANTGGGADWIAMAGVTANGDLLKFVTGGSADKVSFEMSTINSDVSVKTGGLPDEFYLGDGTTFNGMVDVSLGSFADALMVENGVTFNDLANATITGNNRGPNYENLFIYENGVDLATLPDVSTFKLPYEADPSETVYEHFEYRLTTIDHNIPFLDMLKTVLYTRGFAFNEMPIDQTVLTEAEMDTIVALVPPGLQSPVRGERFMYKLIFAPDLA